jgi:carbon storage regulator CsrA
MLMLSRKRGQRIYVDGPCVIEIDDILGNRVKLAVIADREVRILRGELLPAPNQPPAEPGKAA